MNKRWAPAFTVVELIIVIAVLGILVIISVVAYNGVQKTAAERAIQSDLQSAASEMQRSAQMNAGVYPTTIPSALTTSANVNVTLKRSGPINVYTSLNAVQNGVLFAQICQDLINENQGKGVDQGGDTQEYLTGCGNWNHDSMQITGWNSRVYSTPLTKETLMNYANGFTVSDSYHKAHETTVKNFYAQLVERLVRQGGSFPVTSFWDYWATPESGGVALQPLSTPKQVPTYCIEATHAKFSTLKWHITDELKLETGGC